MRWIIVCLMLFLAMPAWAEKKKKKISQPQPQTQQVIETEPVESNLWNQKICPNGIEDIEVLLKINPYDSEGRCFNYVGRLVQLLNKSQALYSFMTASTPFSIVDFGKDSVPMGPFYAVVKGKGAYSYETVSGSRNIVFSFVNVPKSKGREAWEKKRAFEKEAEKAEIQSKAQAKTEQEWKEKIERLQDSTLISAPLIYTDPSTGLMWARNGSIAEMKMDRKYATEWVKKLNYAGYSDWRLPTKEECEKIIKLAGGEYFPFKWFNKNGFYNVQNGEYSTGSKYSNTDSRSYWYVDMDRNGELRVQTDQDYYVWPVRDGAAPGLGMKD